MVIIIIIIITIIIIIIIISSSGERAFVCGLYSGLRGVRSQISALRHLLSITLAISSTRGFGTTGAVSITGARSRRLPAASYGN